MAFVKKFESLSVDSSIEYCKDVIETLSDFEDDIEIDRYQNGYTKYSSINSYITDSPLTENDKKCIQFYLKLKEKYEDNSKETFDKVISLLQRSKYLFSKLKSYCSEIKFEIDNNSVGFILFFDNKDESVKRTAKVARIYKSINEALKDYSRYKRIFISFSEKGGYKSEIYSILREQNPQKNYFTIGYSIDVSLEDDVIILKPNKFRYDDGTWKKVKYSKKLANLISKHLRDLIDTGYIYGIKEHISFEEGDGSLKISIK